MAENKPLEPGTQQAFDSAGRVMIRMADTFKNLNAINTNAEITAWTPAAGKKFRLMGLYLSTTVSATVLIKDNTAGTTILTLPMIANTPIGPLNLGNGILSAAANNVLTITGGAASTTTGILFGTEE